MLNFINLQINFLQKQLPLHAQATATMAIKTNIQLTEEEELNESELYQKVCLNYFIIILLKILKNSDKSDSL